MKRLCFSIILCLITASVSFPDTIINDINYFSKLFPRIEGSSNEKETFSYIKQRLNEIGVEYSERDFSESEGYHSFSSAVEADIKGNAENILVIAVPVDTAFDESDRSAGSFTIAAALNTAEYFQANKPAVSIKILFLGAEFGRNRNYPLGSRNFLDSFYPEAPAAVIYLNLQKPSNKIRIISGTDGYTTPFWLFSSTSDALKSAGFKTLHSKTQSVLYRLRASGENNLIKLYLEEEYPAVELQAESGRTAEEPGEAAEKLLTFIKAFTASESGGFPDEWDSHYVFGLGETSYIFLLLIIIALLMIYPIFKRRHFGWYMHTLSKNLWSLPMLYIVTFGLLALGTLLTSTILELISFPDLWEYNPGLIFIFKISLSMLFYSLLMRLLIKLPFSRKGSFYSISAIFFLVISLIVLTIIDISLSYFSLWALFFIFIFSVVKKTWMKIVMLILSVFLLATGLYEIFRLPSLTVIRMITLSLLSGNLVLSVIILPFVLAIIRIDMLISPSKYVTRLAPVPFAAVTAGILIFLISYSPFNELNPQPVQVTGLTDETTGTHELSINSPAPLDDATAAEIYAMADQGPVYDSQIGFELESRKFLNRRVIEAEISFEEKPDEVSIEINSDKDLILFDSSFPSTYFPGERRIEIYTGKNPPSPLDFMLTINSAAIINITVEAKYFTPPSLQQIQGQPLLISSDLSIISRYSDD